MLDRRYDLEAEIECLKDQERRLASQLPDSDGAGELNASLAIKRREVDELQDFLDDLQLEPHDLEVVNELVEDMDVRIAEPNDMCHDLRHPIAQIEKSLEEERLLFSTAEAKRLFEEADIVFAGQLERSFEQVLAFNSDTTEERRSHAMKDFDEARARLKQAERESSELDSRRSMLLDELGSKDVITKYRAATNDWVLRRTEPETFRQRHEQIRNLQRVRREIAGKKPALAACDAEIQDEIDGASDVEDTGMFARLRPEFDGIVHKVTSQHGMASDSVNSEGHAEFKADVSL